MYETPAAPPASATTAAQRQGASQSADKATASAAVVQRRPTTVAVHAKNSGAHVRGALTIAAIPRRKLARIAKVKPGLVGELPVAHRRVAARAAATPQPAIAIGLTWVRVYRGKQLVTVQVPSGLFGAFAGGGD